MEYRYCETLTDPDLRDGVWDLLCRYDHAFIPPLSAREHTCQSDLSAVGSTAGKKPKQYFEKLKEQSFLLALERDRVAGFMSFRPRYVSAELNDGVETIYVRRLNC